MDELTQPETVWPLQPATSILTAALLKSQSAILYFSLPILI
jgi:hypothetical protein